MRSTISRIIALAVAATGLIVAGRPALGQTAPPHAITAAEVARRLAGTWKAAEVRTSVKGRGGRTYAPSLIEVHVRLGDPVAIAPQRIAPAVAVVDAVKRDLDDKAGRWTLDGARVSLSLVNLSSPDLNLQFDTSDGRDAFGTTLMRRR
jgi:hypothetical protein